MLILHIQERALAHNYYVMIGFAFQKWKQRYQNSVRSVEQVKLATEHCDYRLMELVWTTWAKVGVSVYVGSMPACNILE